MYWFTKRKKNIKEIKSKIRDKSEEICFASLSFHKLLGDTKQPKSSLSYFTNQAVVPPYLFHSYLFLMRASLLMFPMTCISNWTLSNPVKLMLPIHRGGSCYWSLPLSCIFSAISGSFYEKECSITVFFQGYRPPTNTQLILVWIALLQAGEIANKNIYVVAVIFCQSDFELGTPRRVFSCMASTLQQ